MELAFDDKKLERLYSAPKESVGLPTEVERGFRKVLGLIRQVPDERVLASFVGLHMEKLKGNRSHQRSLRINKQWRLIIEIRGDGADKHVAIVEIIDYH